LGLLAGDVIEAYDGKPVFAVQQAIDLITQPGESNRRLDVIREGQHLVFQAPPGRLGIRVGVTFIRADPAEIGGHAER
jgi:C-terminal processing protease CtpA/Prc